MQAYRLLAEGDGLVGRPAGVQLPRLAVLAYWTAPYFWYGVAYFSFLFADRLTAGTALATFTGEGFGLPAAYTAGIELALLTFLVAAIGVEVAGALFARATVTEAARPFKGDPAPLAASLRGHHRRVVALALVTFVVTALAIGALATRLLPGGLTSLAWSVLLAGDVGYACLAVGFANALVLFQTRRPWVAVRALTVGLFVNLASGYVLSHLFGSFYAVLGLCLGAAYFAVVSTVDVHRILRRPDYVYAAG